MTPELLFCRYELISNSGAGVSTTGLWHYPANITNYSIATEFAQFAPAVSSGFSNFSTAGVINNINGRQQVSVAKVALNREANNFRWSFS